MRQRLSIAVLLTVTGCFGSHGPSAARDASVADGSPDAAPACWPPSLAPGVVPCDVDLSPAGHDDPCYCGAELSGRCVIYTSEWPLLHGYCYREPLEGCDPSQCRGGLTCIYDHRLIDVPADQRFALLHMLPRCVPPTDCIRVRAVGPGGPTPQCAYGDFTVAQTGHVPAPTCAERPGGLQMCSAGCACDAGYECGPYSEEHPWAPCYPTGTLVPSMPFDGAWMTRVLTPEQARLNGGAPEAERHYVDRDYCPAVVAQFPGLYACDALPAPAP